MAEEKKHKGLDPSAYETIPGDQYKPYIPTEKIIPEYTPLSVIFGIIQGIIFGMAMVYVGLKVGMTISASIPAAVISMGIMKGVFRKGTILECNISKTIASAGESMAAGVIFTIPAAFLWPEFKGEIAANFPLWKLSLVAAIGGVLGVVMMIPLRRYLIVQEHGKLKYPEGTACAEVLVAGEVGGNPAKLVFTGLGLGALFKFCQESLKFWKYELDWKIPLLKNMVFSGEASPILLGVGYIVGLEIAAFMLAGGLIAWFVLIPLISYFGANHTMIVAPADKLICNMEASEVWSFYIRYIGAGAVAIGGLISLSKSMPTIIASFKAAVRELIADLTQKGGHKVVKDRLNDDLPIGMVLGITITLIVLIALTRIVSDQFVMGIIGAGMVAIFGFFFVTVSSRIVGLVGSSSNPVSGMTIGTLIVSTLIFRALGFKGIDGMVTSLMVGGFVCTAMCIAGDISQDLKTGFLVGGTPRAMQLGEIFGTVASSFFVIWTVYQLVPFVRNGSFPAPQANLMAMIIRGIMEANLPWGLVIAGGFIAVAIELMGAPALPVAVGLYLPLSLSTPVMVGGLLAWLTARIYKGEEYKKRNERGVLVSSGLIAGEALMGLVIVGLAAKEINLAKGWENQPWVDWRWPAIVAFGLVAYYLWSMVSSKNIIDEMEEESNDGSQFDKKNNE